MRFWRRLPITDRPGDLSLGIQFLATLLLAAVIRYVIAFAWHIETYWRYQGGTGPLFKYPWLGYATEWTDRLRHVLVSLCSIGLIVTIILALFWQTLGKYRIRRNVAMRVGAYASFTLIVCWTAVWTATNLADMTTLVFTRNSTWRISHYITGNHLASAVAFPCFFLCLGAGLRTHLGIRGGWRLAALAMLTTSVIVAFIVIQSALVTGTFDPWSNEALRYYICILPRFWGY